MKRNMTAQIEKTVAAELQVNVSVAIEVGHGCPNVVDTHGETEYVEFEVYKPEKDGDLSFTQWRCPECKSEAWVTVQ